MYLTILLMFGGGSQTVIQLHPVLVPLIGLGLYSTARAPASAIIGTLLGNRLMEHLGHISYSVYLWHGAALLLIGQGAQLTGWVGMIASLLLTLALSEAAYWGVERPAVGWRISRATPRYLQG